MYSTAGWNNWNRPSGGDIANQIYLKSADRYPNLKESYIVQPDGRFVRYKVTDLGKAREQYNLAQDEWDKKDRKPFGYSGAVDYAIESKWDEMRNAEQLLGDKAFFDSRKSQKELNLAWSKFDVEDRMLKHQIEKLEKKGIAKAKKNPNLDVNKTAEFKRLNRLDKKRIDLFDNLMKEEERLRKIYPPRKNPKFIPDKKKNESDNDYKDRRHITVQRRTFNIWVKYMKSEWGIEITRMPKNFKREF